MVWAISSNEFDVLINDHTPFGTLNAFVSGSTELSGVASDLDAVDGQTSVKLIANGTEVSNSTLVANQSNNGFTYINIGTLLSNSGVDLNASIELSLQVLDIASPSAAYVTVDTQTIAQFINNAPVVVNDALVLDVNTSDTINVLGNDTDSGDDSGAY